MRTKIGRANRVSLSKFNPQVEMLEARQLLTGVPLFGATNLVSDGAVPAAHVDADLKNPWGISFAPGNEFWVSDNGSGKSTLYDGTGTEQSLIVNIPGPGGAVGTPTGQVFSPSGFDVSSNGSTGPSAFIFSSEDGTISLRKIYYRLGAYQKRGLIG